MPFLNRWLIEGCLTTWTPLRIGGGDTTTRAAVKDEKGNLVEIATVAVDARRRAYLPGSTLKGNLRACARRSGMPPRLIEVLFGSADPRDPNAVAGKAEFWDAPAEEQTPPGRTPPYWCAQRLTGVAAGVAINRRRRTAREKKLFHYEYVPPGITFTLTVSGRDMNDDDECYRDERGLTELLALLEGFNTRAVTLGAETDDGLGWGCCVWNLTTVKRLDHAGINDWIRAGAARVGYAALEPLPPEKIQELRDAGIDLHEARQPAALSRYDLALNVSLDCQENFLVNDPSQTGKGSELPDRAPLRDGDDNPVLPRRSIKGAVRAQAETILRTMGEKHRGSMDSDEIRALIERRVACHADDPQNGCGAVQTLREVREKLCLACKIFGAPGWRAPFKCSAFVAPHAAPPDDGCEEESGGNARQEFVAIDRFTGGGADEKKFNADAVYQPKLAGWLGLDFVALESAGVGRWALGLLALTVRDLMEGDVHIGFGAAKGYGSIEARIAEIALNYASWDALPAAFRADLTEEEINRLNPDVTRDELENSELGMALQLAVAELEEEIKNLE